MEQESNSKKIKITSSSGIFMTIYHIGSYLLLFGFLLYNAFLLRRLPIDSPGPGNSLIQT